MGMKRLKLVDSGDDAEKVDLISDLPDDLLSYILSFLPMKDEVKTSILSSRWRFQWSCRPSLDFDIYTILGDSIPEHSIKGEEALKLLKSTFVSRVDKFLHLFLGSKIYFFRISYFFDKESACHLDCWIKLAVTLGVEILDLSFSYGPYLHSGYNNRTGYELYSFPCSLLTQGKTSPLKHLHLESCIVRCPPNFCGFNMLLTVDLQDVILAESCLESIFSSCSLLELLSVRRCVLPANLKAVGSCVNLTCLSVHECTGVENIVVSAVKLTTFNYTGRELSFSFLSVPRMERLVITIWKESRIGIPRFLAGLPKHLPRLRSLYLSLFHREMKTLPTMLLSTVANVKELELASSGFDDTNLLWIASAVNALPLLRKLRLMLLVNGYGKREIRTSGPLHNHLKEVKIQGFSGCWNEIELVIYLLKSAVALERMVFEPCGLYLSKDGNWKRSCPSYYWSAAREKEVREVIHREVPQKAKLVTFFQSMDPT